MPAKTHGDSYSQEYRSWKMMKSRCGNPNDPAYERYGGRGITVCPRWHRFEPFLEDIGRRPSPLHQLERVDNNRGYEPGNVRWATPKENQRNKRNTAFIVLSGRRIPLVEAAETAGIPVTTLRHRLDRGWSPERAVAQRASER
jgi:hypothetical protein